MRISDWSSDVCSSDLQDRDEPRQHEQRTGDQPAFRLVEQPADIGGELLRLGAGKQHAIVERVEESFLTNPAFFVDQDAVHHRDLPGGAAEAQRCDPRPNAGCFTKGNTVIRSEEHTSELQSLMRISYAVFCLKKKIKRHKL